jgi:heme-degrading monooxygenase HmoA
VSHVIVWEFLVREGREPAFEELYGPRGAWAVLFAASPDFGGTELLCDTVAGARRYLTLDRWSSPQAFAAFRAAHAVAYEALDRRCEALTERETPLGAWKTTA